MKGVVIKSTGSWYAVRTENGELLDCRIRGKFRIKGIKSTNPVAVGDHVTVEKENDGTAIITDIDERKNYIIRKSVNLSKQTHILAANIDLAILVVTIAQPRTSSGFIDRFLVTAEAYSIPVMIVFNKRDIYDEEQLSIAAEWMDLYSAAGYSCRIVSAFDEKDISQLREKIKGKVTLFSGHSGSGKSSLINAIQPGLGLKIGDISQVHFKGTHTTTFAEMFSLDEGGDIIDTPGIKELGLVEISKHELSHYFPEMRKLMNQCRFDNCIHVNEPGCRVKKAVEEGTIPAMRYESYLNMLSSDL